MNLRAKHLRLFAALTLVVTARTQADPTPGATRGAVIAELGEPAGRLAIGDREELRYPRGTVSLENGLVTTVRLLTTAEWEKRERERIAEEKYKVESAAQESTALANRRKKANAALAGLLLDSRWKELTGEGRLETLARFGKAFPDADLDAVTKEAVRKHDVELAEKRRLSELEKRLASAESRVVEAESRALNAEKSAESARAAARRAADAASLARGFDEFHGLRTYNMVGGGKIDGAYPYHHYRGTGSSVVVSNGVIVVTPGFVPPGATARPIIIARPTPTPAPRQEKK